MALPGDGNIRTRKIAILVANGMEGDSVAALQEALVQEGAIPRLVGLRLGKVKTAAGDVLEADASMENTPAVLFDALVLPDGADAMTALMRDGHTMEFIKDQYRHCKTILALGASTALLDKAGISATLPDGAQDSGLLFADGSSIDEAIEAFIAAIGKHRHTARDSDPPLV